MSNKHHDPDAPHSLAAALNAGFSIKEVSPDEGTPGAKSRALALTTNVAADPSLGPLAVFTGTFTGPGFNNIFRPDSQKTPTQFLGPVDTTDPPDNVLELNVTSETLAFGDPLGAVPNRGTGTQGDIMLNGVPYVQKVSDVTVPGVSTPIHFEPGMFLIVPPTTIPTEGVTLVRMASIPHGTTINAQGTSTTTPGAPVIPPVKITPFVIGSNPPNFIPFQNTDVTNEKTRRIPQNLTPFVAEGRITQVMVDNPNSVLTAQLAGQSIASTTTFTLFTKAATAASVPSFGGGTDNIAFLLGDANVTNPNADAIQMTSTFWVETVNHSIVVPPSDAGADLFISAPSGPGVPAVTFEVRPPTASNTPRTIDVTSTQIQYSQTVILNFAGLSWPHVSVATLVPQDPIKVTDFKLKA